MVKTISSEVFGQLPGGESVLKYTLSNNNGVKAVISELGAAILNIIVPDQSGASADVVLGYNSFDDYVQNEKYFGVAVGRSSNRIAGAKAFISGKTYELEANNGPNNLHTGKGCISFMHFKGEASDINGVPALVLTCEIPDMSDGFPGNISLRIIYILTDSNELLIDYNAVSDADTIMNFTNHSYFNLAGHDSGTIESHILKLNAPFFTPNNDMCMPTGEIKAVGGTAFDFLSPKAIGEGINSEYDQIKMFDGYDHNFVLAGEGLRQIAIVRDPGSGRVMEVFTDLPGVQFYTANNVSVTGVKDGADYIKHQGFCLETQFFPDAINMPWLKSPLYKAGQELISRTVYKFDW